MRIGNFWGLPAPMAILLFRDSPELLYGYLKMMGKELSPGLMLDIQKEFQYLLKHVSNNGWELPEYERVSVNFPLDTCVDGMAISGADTLTNVLFETELCCRAIELAMKYEARGEFFKLPQDLRGWLKGVFSGRQCHIGEINKVLREAIKDTGACSESVIPSIAEKYGLKRTCPEFYWDGDRRVRLSETQKAVWQYYSDAAGMIAECIDKCSGQADDEETIFGVSFFDLIKRKPVSIKYSVINVFQRAKERQYAKLLPDCRDECIREIQKYRDAILKNVEFGNEKADAIISDAGLEEIFSVGSASCQSFFKGLIQDGRLPLPDLQTADLQMLVEIYSRIERFEMVGFGTAFGVECGDVDSFISECCGIGICGLNYCSFDLFEDAVMNISLSEKGKIRKSSQDLQELSFHLNDISALLDTLIPIGTHIAE